MVNLHNVAVIAGQSFIIAAQPCVLVMQRINYSLENKRNRPPLASFQFSVTQLEYLDWFKVLLKQTHSNLRRKRLPRLIYHSFV